MGVIGVASHLQSLRLGRQPAAEGWDCMLWTIVVLLLLFWLIGLMVDIAGGLIHILLVVALVVIAYRLLTGRRVV
jgi:hypothetical protein